MKVSINASFFYLNAECSMLILMSAIHRGTNAGFINDINSSEKMWNNSIRDCGFDPHMGLKTLI